MTRTKKGFTLIELLIVVVIIGILAAIAIPKFANTKEKAYIASMKSDLRNLVTSEEAYFSDNQVYLAGSASNLSGLGTALDATTNYVPSAGVTVTVQFAWAPAIAGTNNPRETSSPTPHRLRGVTECPFTGSARRSGRAHIAPGRGPRSGIHR
jgi:prepilin-type N-terminal cleavage/methylation domain-containing protein